MPRLPESAPASSGSSSGPCSIGPSWPRGASGRSSVGISGGVSANRRLRADAAARAERDDLPLFLPSLALATDNAAMIGAAGLRRLHAGVTASLDLNARASLPLDAAHDR